jgi:hypothetical protein
VETTRRLLDERRSALGTAPRRQAFTRVALAALRAGGGLDHAQRREVAAELGQRGHRPAGRLAGERERVLQGALPLEAHRLHRAEPQGGGRDALRRRRVSALSRLSAAGDRRLEGAAARQRDGARAVRHHRLLQRQGRDAVAGERPYALASVLYDLCNDMALDARWSANAYEVDLAVAHLAHARSGRSGAGRPQLPVLPHARRAEPARDRLRHPLLQPSSFRQARAMLRGEGPDSRSSRSRPPTASWAPPARPACRRA